MRPFSVFFSALCVLLGIEAVLISMTYDHIGAVRLAGVSALCGFVAIMTRRTT